MTKYSLDQNFLVDVIYKEDLLPEENTLIDVAYSYNWRKVRESNKQFGNLNSNLIISDESDEILLQDLPEDESVDQEEEEEEHQDQQQEPSGQEAEG